MFRFSSKIIVSVILCLTLSINSFAIATVDSIKIDGTVTPKEWEGIASICLIKGEQSPSFNLAQLFIVADFKKSEICIGVNVAEKNSISSKSSVRIIFDGEHSTGWANGAFYDRNYYMKEFATHNVSDESYSMEARFVYSGLSKNTNFSLAFVDSFGVQSPEFCIDLGKMALKQDDTDGQSKKDEQTTDNKQTKPAKTTKETTTKEQVANGTNAKEKADTKASVDTQNNKVSSGKSQAKSSKKSIQSKNSESYMHTSSMAGVLADNINKGKDKTKYKKVAGTIVAVGLLTTAIVLPVRRLKDKNNLPNVADE